MELFAHDFCRWVEGHDCVWGSYFDWTTGEYVAVDNDGDVYRGGKAGLKQWLGY